VDWNSQVPQDQQMSAKADITVRFGHRVRELRHQTGLSQEAFADKCGLDRTYISGIERGRRNVALRSVERVAKALGISMSKLFEGV
jgi:transcriptional regulator with XRE-family HTH domain